MTTPESWAVDDAHDPGYQSVTAATPSAGLDTLTAFKDVVEATDLKGVFESAIAILTLVKVRPLALFPFSDPLTSDTTRTR